jgi:hypothetical protein
MAGLAPEREIALKIRRLRELKKAQGGLCYYCNRPMWVAEPDAVCRAFNVSIGGARFLRCTAEHLMPRSEGGQDASDNIVAACRFRNQTRHRARRPRAPEAYRSLVRRRIDAGRWLQLGGASIASCAQSSRR